MLYLPITKLLKHWGVAVECSPGKNFVPQLPVTNIADLPK